MPSVNGGPAISSSPVTTSLMQDLPQLITTSRDFSENGSDGRTYDVQTAAAITLTIYPGLNWMKGISVMLPTSAVNVTFLPIGGVTINGATAPLTRALSSTQRVVSLLPRNALNTFDLTGQ